MTETDMYKILFLEFRGLGDSIIKSSFIARIKNDNVIIDVLAYPSCAGIFRLNKRVRNVYMCEYPRHDMNISNLAKSIKNIRIIQKEKYDLCVDTSADFRERIIGKICSAKQFISVERNGMSFGRTGLRCLTNQTIRISINEKNIYQQFELIFDKLGLNLTKPNNIAIQQGKKCVGVHPFASLKSNMCNWSVWQALITEILSNNINVILFCSPKEKEILKNKMGNVIGNPQVSIISGKLNEFLNNVKLVDLMIGVDSFSLHAAYYMGIRSIMLCTSNLEWHTRWKTPFTEIVYDVDKDDESIAQKVREKVLIFYK